MMDKDIFIRDLLMLYGDGDDIDAVDLQDLMLKHGLLVARPLTAEEAQQEWARQWDCGEGDPWNFYSDELKAILGREGFPS